MTLYRQISHNYVQAIRIPNGYRLRFGDANEKSTIDNVETVEAGDYLVVDGNYLHAVAKADFERDYEPLPARTSRA